MSNFDYNTIPPGYYDEVFNKKSGIQSAWHFLKFSFISSLIPTEGTHLDIGCGPGTFLGNFRSVQSVGLDISFEQIDYATKKYSNANLAFVKLESSDLPFESNSIDSISLIEVLEHLDTSTIFCILSESYRCLKPGGFLVVSTPNYSSMWPILEFFVNKLSKLSYEEQHITKFNTPKLIKLISNQGFTINKSGSFLLLSPFIAFISWYFSQKLFTYESILSNRNYGFLSYCVARKPIQAIVP